MSDPRIAGPVTEKLLKRVLGSNGASHPASSDPAPAPAAPSHYVLDPLTNLPVKPSN